MFAGRVGRPHGLDGSFHVVDAVPQLLTAGTPLTVDGRATEIVRRQTLADVWSLDAVLADVPAPSAVDQPAPEHPVGASS